MEEVKKVKAIDKRFKAIHEMETPRSKIDKGITTEDKLKRLEGLEQLNLPSTEDLESALRTLLTSEPFKLKTDQSPAKKQLKYASTRSSSDLEQDMKNPELTDDAPPLIRYYCTMDWSEFSTSDLISAAVDAVDDRITITERAVAPEGVFLFEALNENFIIDVIMHTKPGAYKASNLKRFSHQEERNDKRTMITPWFGRDPTQRAEKVEEIIKALTVRFKLPNPGFNDNYNAFMQNLHDLGCNNDKLRSAIKKNPTFLWSHLLNNTRCLPNTLPHLRKAVRYMLAISPSTAEVERGFSILFHIKSSRRSRMLLPTLNANLQLRIRGGGKGFFPHLYNHPDNYDKELKTLPAKEYYSPQFMTPSTKKEFDDWCEGGSLQNPF
ncbi:hypothetical protein CRE_20933 [Caenorhabditis remanei]|uniref:HAT C-terminal dimerisation domain-containing protein n=1 Tax=Caenorhabditis remanei TaxID=31234 RepID=E3N937_CAERE|nr:hypothetical protein CRE_20933 [Caenorhabditis remanei]